MLYKTGWALIALFCLGFSFYQSNEVTVDNNDAKGQALIRSAMAELNENHYEPRVIDDEFSAKVFTTYLSRIDYEKRFLTQKGVDELKRFETKIDDELKGETLDFFNASTSLLNSGIEQAKKYYEDWMANEMDLSVEGEWETNGAKRDFAADHKALKNRWNKILQNEVNKNLLILEKGTNPKENLTDLKKQAIAETRNTIDQLFTELAERTYLDQLSEFVNAVVLLYGPHNYYLTPKDEKEFNIGLTRSLQGVGMIIIKEGPYLKIQEVAAGGPAWKSKQFDIGDILLKAQEPGKQSINLAGMSVDKSVSYLRGEKGTEVMVTVRKQSGEIRAVSITRDVIILEAGVAKSLILSNEKLTEKIGYIRLPRFYFSRGDGPNCAADIKKEIEKLEKNNVDGIILDLRNNRGGSMSQTLKMIGFFIEAGPAVHRESQDRSVRTFYDKDSSVVYDGELVILVNAYSGSASELLSGTLQDYGRAVVVGSKSTFGKGTIQNLRDLDQEEIVDANLFPLGTLKMTVGKFYRVSGASTQLKGVKPDIVLPDANSFLKTGEKAQLHPLPWTEINSEAYAQEVNTNPNLELVKTRSQNRTKSSNDFASMLKHAQQQKELEAFSTVPLNFEAFKTSQKTNKTTKEIMTSFNKVGIKAMTVPQDEAYVLSDPARKARNEEMIENIHHDIYVNECLLIVHDLLIAN